MVRAAVASWGVDDPSEIREGGSLLRDQGVLTLFGRFLNHASQVRILPGPHQLCLGGS